MNYVHIEERGDKMNYSVTSKDLLLQAAKGIVQKDGMEKLNIRAISKECGISVGTVYNYFPSKADLIFAMVEDFWKNVFHSQTYDIRDNISFPELFGRVYQSLFQNIKQFQQEFLSQMVELTGEEKRKGKNIEEIYFKHIKEGFLRGLEVDDKVKEGIFDENFTKEKFLSFVFSQMMWMLKNGQENSSFFQEVLKRILDE